MTDQRLAHYDRVWDYMTNDLRDGGADKSQSILTGFVVHAVIDQRPLANIITQWEIDAESLVDQSLTELRGFAECLPDYLAAHQEMPRKVSEAFAALADFFVSMADHADAREGLRDLWAQVVPQLKEGTTNRRAR